MYCDQNTDKYEGIDAPNGPLEKVIEEEEEQSGGSGSAVQAPLIPAEKRASQRGSLSGDGGGNVGKRNSKSSEGADEKKGQEKKKQSTKAELEKLAADGAGPTVIGAAAKPNEPGQE